VARIPYRDPKTYSEDVAKLMGKAPAMNIFRMLTHADAAARQYMRLGNALLTRGELDPVLRELAILRVGHLSRAQYEVHQHERIGRDLGIAEEKLEALKQGAEAPPFSPLEKAVLRFTDDVAANVRASEMTFAPLRERLSERALAELTLCIGFYMMTCRFLETFDVDLEPEDVDLGLS
jgi:4-carboxymuconolactone decarboxylase